MPPGMEDTVKKQIWCSTVGEFPPMLAGAVLRFDSAAPSRQSLALVDYVFEVHCGFLALGRAIASPFTNRATASRAMCA